MAAGRFDQKLLFQEATQTSDGMGGGSVAWATAATVWGSVIPERGSEEMQGAGLDNPQMYRIRVYRRSDITGATRIVWPANGSKVLNIRSIRDRGPRALYMEIMAEEGVAPDG